jgi:hypothetical protein
MKNKWSSSFAALGIVLGLSFFMKPIGAVNISPSPYGINVHLAADALLSKVNDVGIKWIRIDILWNQIEVNNNNFLYGSVDRVINFAHQNGMSVVGVLAYSPTWTNKARKTTLPPDDINLWRRFVEKTVNRYKTKVKYWSIWNEPNLPVFFEAGKDVFLNQIFIPGVQSVKKADPGAFIVGPDLAHKTAQNQEWYFWLKYILDNAGQLIDIITHHIYKDEGVIYLFELLEKGDTLIPSVKQIIEDAGHGSKPFWITETGWHTSRFSEEVQGERYLEFLQLMRQKGFPHKIFFYEIIDDVNVGVDPFGILRSNRSEKPAFRIYADFIAGAYPPLEDGDVPGDSKKCYAEESVASLGDAPRQKTVLQALRMARGEVLSTLPQGLELVRAYYRHGAEFSALTREDARLSSLGQTLLFTLLQTWQETDPQALSALQGTVVSKGSQLLALLGNKPISANLRKTLGWCAEQLHLIREEGLDLYKRHHLPELQNLDH